MRSDRTELDDAIEAAQALLAAKAKLDSLSQRQVQIEKYRTAKREQRLDLLASAWRDLMESRVSVRRLQLERERRVLSEQDRLHAAVEVQVAQVRALLNTKECPVCGQRLADERRAEIGAHLGRLEGEDLGFGDHGAALQGLSAQIEALSKVKGLKTRDRIAQVDQDLQGHEVELTKVENEIAALQDELRGHDTAEVSRKRALRDARLQEEATLQRDIAACRKDCDRIKTDLAVGQRTIAGLTQARSQRSTVKTTVCTELEAVFSQSIEKLRDRLRETVEQRATEAFRKMTTQKAYRGLEINRSYGLNIVDERNQKVAVRSAGAEQVVALSLIDGLNRTGRSAGPVVMDTPFGRLDLSHRDNILAYLPTVTSQFVLLVHSGEIRRDTDLAAIASRIGAVYEIREISPRHSVIEREVA